MKKEVLNQVLFLLFVLSGFSFELAAQEKNLEKSFNNTLSTNLGTEKIPTNDENLEMQRQTWTIRGLNNQLFSLEYFFPQVVVPAPFIIDKQENSSGPKDYATSVLIKDDVESAEDAAGKSFKDMPSVDKLVNNTDSGVEKDASGSKDKSWTQTDPNSGKTQGKTQTQTQTKQQTKPQTQTQTKPQTKPQTKNQTKTQTQTQTKGAK
jgi:hypothetical protein